MFSVKRIQYEINKVKRELYQLDNMRNYLVRTGGKNKDKGRPKVARKKDFGSKEIRWREDKTIGKRFSELTDKITKYRNLMNSYRDPKSSIVFKDPKWLRKQYYEDFKKSVEGDYNTCYGCLTQIDDTRQDCSIYKTGCGVDYYTDMDNKHVIERKVYEDLLEEAEQDLKKLKFKRKVKESGRKRDENDDDDDTDDDDTDIELDDSIIPYENDDDMTREYKRIQNIFETTPIPDAQVQSDYYSYKEIEDIRVKVLSKQNKKVKKEGTETNPIVLDSKVMYKSM